MAYLYYAVVYNKLFPLGVTSFQNMFKREFYNFICEGDQKTTALKKVIFGFYFNFLSGVSFNVHGIHGSSSKYSAKSLRSESEAVV